MVRFPIRDVASIVVRSDRSLREALQQLDRGGVGIVLIVDRDGRLEATLSDGDVRRAVLAGVDLSEPAIRAANPKPTSADREGASSETLTALFRERGVRQIPLLDRDRRPVGLCVASDLTTATRDNAVVIMAGGKGARLGSLTAERPKPLVDVGGRPILETLVTQLAAAGFVKIVLAVNYQAERIIEHFGDGSAFGVRIDYVRETEPLGTAGALRLAKAELDRTFLVVNADLLTNAHFGDIVDTHLAQANTLTLGVSEVDIELRYGVVDVAADDRVETIREKPKIKALANAGIYAVEPAALAYLPEGSSSMPELVSAVLGAGHRVGCFRLRDLWLDIGELSDLQRAHAMYESFMVGER